MVIHALIVFIEISLSACDFCAEKLRETDKIRLTQKSEERIEILVLQI